jgi:hypothetical protein
MKRIILILVVIFSPVSVLFSQIKSPRYGLEIDVIPFHIENFSQHTPPSVSGFAGVFFEMNLTSQFAMKLTAGLNNIHTKSYPLGLPADINLADIKMRSMLLNTFEFIVEPRYYLFGESKPWGNLFGATRLAIETGPFQKRFSNTPTYKAIPTIGYQYNFSKHLFVEVNAGLGWSMVPYDYETDHRFDHLLGARLGFAF